MIPEVWLVDVDIIPDEALDVDGSVRHYRLVIPKRLPRERVPIVFAFHGAGDSPEKMAAYSALDRLTAENGLFQNTHAIGKWLGRSRPVASS